mmetsp:Transcript_32226/g.96213  ORF Transcript_32226/g.96213 Transcript_32226/m.96213 type:complete len:233 (-) Transcript_32226:65-763(-)
MAVPATTTLAPFPAASSIVLQSTPPSTWMSNAAYLSRSTRHLSAASGMYFCPPKPGRTVITSTMSTSPASMYGNSSVTSVSGFNVSPTCMFAARTASHSAHTSGCAASANSADVPPSTAASMWKVNMSAPAAAKSVTHCLGWLTIRWQSNTAAECLRRHLMMGAPMVRLGTKWPSMTSRCSQSAPSSSIRLDSSASRAKSDDSMDGHMIVGGRSRSASLTGNDTRGLMMHPV